MVDFNSVLDSARQLTPRDQARLIDALWELVPDNVELPLHPEWEAELERRVADLKSSAQKTVPWSQIHSEALARVHHGRVD
jgi:putative addiction module component (TIGR02574 family)